jgi:hypothetical protein
LLPWLRVSITVRSFVLVILVLVGAAVAACGDSGSGSGDPDAAPGDPDGAAGGPCDGRACVAAIATEADWAAVSAASELRCDIDAEGKFLMPATSAASFQHTVYQDVNRHRLHLEFMQRELTEYFGGLQAQQYYALVQRRATREYWAGALFRMTVDGETVGYAFDVIVDPTSEAEQLEAEELEAIHDQLAETFALPLGYAPQSAIALDRARGMALSFPLYLPDACAVERCADPTASCVVVPAETPVCGAFAEGRSIQAEHASQVRLRMAAGEWKLPAAGDAPVAATLFLGGEYGPDRVALVPEGAGEWTHDRAGGSPRHAYAQTLRAGADVIDVRWELYLGDGPGVQVTVAEPWLTESFFASGAKNGGEVYPDDHLQLGSCTRPSLDLYRATGTLAGGDGFTIDVRYRIPGAGSGPLAPVAADVTLGGASVHVEDYFQLVYAGEHHNWNNQYWVLFAEPLTYAGHPVRGLWIDEAAYTCCPVDGIYTLGEDLAALDTLTVVDYSFGPAE